jgi:nucleoside-diphosphate-sugar epimerase
MKIVVTGGTGFLGRHVVWRMAAAGHEVVFTGRDEAQAALVTLAAPAPVRFVRVEHGSAAAAQMLAFAAAGADTIVHSAALAAPWGSRDAFWRANVSSTQEVLDACVSQGVPRLVLVSSPSVYFRFEDRLAIGEDEPLPAPVNHYAASKIAAEALVRSAPLASRVILRPRAIFGPWDQALLPRLLRLMRTGRVPLLRGGRALLDLTYVDNVVDAVCLASALAPATEARTFNISNGEPIAAAELFAEIGARFQVPLRTAPRPYWLADLAARALEGAARLGGGAEPLFTRYSLATIAYSQTLDLERARRELGYQPRVTLEQGMARTAAWWLAQGGAK